MSVWDFNMKPIDVPNIKTRYRKIVTKLPVPESLRFFKQLSRYEARSMHGQIPIIWDKAKDFQVFDKYGNCWIDFTSTIFVTNTGHSNPNVIAGLEKQLKKGLIHSYTFASEVRARFLKKLIEITPVFCEKAFLLSAGTEATECAVKLMRMHGQTIRPSKIAIVSFKGSMHGRTMAAEMLKDDAKSSCWIGYKDPNMHSLPFPYPWLAGDEALEKYNWGKYFRDGMEALEKDGLDLNNICGFMIESYQGWGAVLYPSAYIKALAEFAKKHNSLIVFDEIQGGFGRTGRLFAYEHYRVEPDLLCLGKALSGGVPLSAVIGRKKIIDLPVFGSMSSTHSANPLCCAGALANIEEIISKDLIKESARKGKILHKRLDKIRDMCPDRVFYICGKGLLAGIILKDPSNGKPDNIFANKVCEKAMQKGLLLVHTGRESIKIGPPLTITDEALNEGLDVLDDCFQEVAKEV